MYFNGSSLSARVPSQRYGADFQPSFQLGLHTRDELVEEQIYDNSLGQWNGDNLFPYEDPFAAGLEIVSGAKFPDFVKFISKFFFEKTLSRFVHFILKKNGGKNEGVIHLAGESLSMEMSSKGKLTFL